MGYIKALTPTSAGLAQAFDVSSYAQEEREDKLRREERLQQTMLQYDPKGMYKKHLPGYQKMMQQYQQFVTENHDKLVNSSDNIDTWQQKMQLENNIKNVISGSIQMNQDMNKALPMVLGNDRYISDKNKALLDKIDQYTPSVEELATGSAFIPVMGSLDRNIMVDLDAIAEHAGGLVKTKTELEIGGEPGYDVVTTRTEEEQGAVDRYIKEKYNEQTPDGMDIRTQFENEEDFRDYIDSQLIDQSKTKYMRQKTVTEKEPTATEKKAQFSFMPKTEPSTYVDTRITTATTEKTGLFGRKEKTTEAHLDTSFQLYGTQTYGLNTPTGTGVSIIQQVPEAFNLNTNQFEDVPEAATNIKVLEVSDMLINNTQSPISIPLKGGGSYEVNPNNPLPDRYNKEFAISDAQWEAIKQRCKKQEMATAYVTTEALDLIEHMSGEEIMALSAREGTTGQMMLIDHSKIYETLRGAYGTKWGMDYAQLRQEYKFKNQPLTR